MFNKIKNIFLKKKFNNKKFLLAISGGVDSIVLFNIIYKIFYKYKQKDKISIIHCNFNLNKKNKTYNLIKKICKKKKIKLFYKKFNTKLYSKKKKISIQMAARELRYNFFFKIKKKYKYNYILLGHNLDDSIETFFINLFRKTGLYGLKGIEFISKKKKILRPLIYFYKKDIINYAIINNLKWYEDVSNNKNIYLRNKIRNIILPIIYKNFLYVKKNIVNTINNIKLEYKFIKNKIKDYKKKIIIKINNFNFKLKIKKLIKIKYYQYFLFKIFKKYGFNDYKIFKKLPFFKNKKKIYSKNKKFVITKINNYIYFKLN
ncbi:MAG: tRNA lysidine(34) synthetase TilS [Candidatus Shikimatogenerans bostrichidophilus]|nr:MAG: tRNA lysidine(34) synthetase TilS [Candidatus Shikimatogenerans bostrichidophilus]